MFEKRHRITLLFNANKAYDRQVDAGRDKCRCGCAINAENVFYSG